MKEFCCETKQQPVEQKTNNKSIGKVYKPEKQEYSNYSNIIYKARATKAIEKQKQHKNKLKQGNSMPQRSRKVQKIRRIARK